MPSYTNPSVAALMRTEAGKTVLRAWKTVLRAWKQADMVLPVVNTRYNSNIRIVFIPCCSCRHARPRPGISYDYALPVTGNLWK